jgi:hypothetical protein
MKKYLKGKNVYFSINTFGFGYKLDSKLLNEFSVIGHGINCYLPVCNLVGTTFVNCVCNMLTTVGYNSVIKIDGVSGKEIECIGNRLTKGFINVGTIQYGQSRDFIIRMKKEVPIKVSLLYDSIEGKKQVAGQNHEDQMGFYRAMSRCFYCKILDEGLEKYLNGNHDLGFLKDIETMILNSPSKDDNCSKALIRDIASPDELEGRVSKALSTNERVVRWGQHYVRSMIRAHQIQQCHNFKDPGVQCYGGDLFKQIRDKADVIFCSLPPAEPSRKKPVSPVQSQAPPMVAQTNDMQQFYSGGGGGCFDGEGKVKMANGSFKQVKDLTKGDEVIDSFNRISKVVCLVKFLVKRPLKMVKLNDLKITWTHPILHEGAWKYPRDIANVELVDCDCIYNVALDINHVININGMDIVTLGHGKTDNEKVQHSYYGTQKVIQFLKKIQGWGVGNVTLSRVSKVKDHKSGKVVELI